MINSIKGAIFDMDGTLVDSLLLWDVIWEEFSQRYCDGKLKTAKEHDKAIRTMTLVEATDYINGIYKIADSSKTLLDAANEMIYDFYANRVQTKPGVLNFLESCRKKGIKMCVATATAKNLVEVAIKHCGLGGYFSFVISCGDIGKGKDQPDIYLMAQQKLGTSADETCVFEDSHIAVATASSIGMKTVGIYDKYNYGHEEIRRIANAYIADGETLEKLI